MHFHIKGFIAQNVNHNMTVYSDLPLPRDYVVQAVTPIDIK